MIVTVRGAERSAVTVKRAVRGAEAVTTTTRNPEESISSGINQTLNFIRKFTIILKI